LIGSIKQGTASLTIPDAPAPIIKILFLFLADPVSEAMISKIRLVALYISLSSIVQSLREPSYFDNPQL
jgi:hypothetical protein